MLGLKLNHVSKRGPSKSFVCKWVYSEDTILHAKILQSTGCEFIAAKETMKYGMLDKNHHQWIDQSVNQWKINQSNDLYSYWYICIHSWRNEIVKTIPLWTNIYTPFCNITIEIIIRSCTLTEIILFEISLNNVWCQVITWTDVGPIYFKIVAPQASFCDTTYSK